jgi:hypothetical protein
MRRRRRAEVDSPPSARSEATDWGGAMVGKLSKVRFGGLEET